MSLSSNTKNTYYAIRNIFSNDKSPGFRNSDRNMNENFKHEFVVSYPMYAIYAKLDSVRSIVFEKLAVMLKDPLKI